MLVWTDVAGDSRVLREATTLADAGHSVHVIGRNVPGDFKPPPGVSTSSAGRTSALKRASGNLTSHRMSSPVRLARWALMPSHVAAAHRAWVRAARADASPRGFDVVHAHDFTALELGSELASAGGVPLVYDSHEYWAGRPPGGRPTPLQNARERTSERRLGARAAAVLTVGDGIAERLLDDYGWRHVTVVRNTFPPIGDTAPDPTEPDAAPAPDDPGAPDAAHLGTEPGAPQRPSGLVYAGRIAPLRDLETVAAAADTLAPMEVTLLGPADPTFLASFRPGALRIEPPVPVDEVDPVLRAAGLALVTLTDGWENQRLAQPNKLFHAVRAGVPVVAADFGEVARTIRTYGIGTLYQPGDAASLVQAVRAAAANYRDLVDAVRNASAELSWKRDGDALLEVYADLPGPRGRL
jgi:glycogen synthase